MEDLDPLIEKAWATLDSHKGKYQFGDNLEFSVANEVGLVNGLLEQLARIAATADQLFVRLIIMYNLYNVVRPTETEEFKSNEAELDQKEL